MSELAGRTAIITGGGSGIGRAIALRLAGAGARVALLDCQLDAAEAVVGEVRAAGGEVAAWAVDVGDAEAVRRVFGELSQRGWIGDLLVNSAGNSEERLRPAWEVSDEQWRAIVRVHLDGTFHCCREVLPGMLQRGRGVVINLGSVAGMGGLAGAVAYTAAKGAVIALTKALSQEVAARGVRVNCIAPGWIETPMLNRLPQQWKPRMVASTPLSELALRRKWPRWRTSWPATRRALSPVR